MGKIKSLKIGGGGGGIVDPDLIILDKDFPVVLSGGKTFGRYANGTTIPAIGKTLNQFLDDVMTEYLLPTFATFTLSGLSTTLEVGTQLGGNRTATWTNTNSANIQQGQTDISDGFGEINTNKTVLSVSRTTNVVTLNTTTAHGYKAGTEIFITNIPEIGISGTSFILLSASGTTMTFASVGSNLALTPATGLIYIGRNGSVSLTTPNVILTGGGYICQIASLSTQSNLLSRNLVVAGSYRIFFAPVSTIPTTSAQVRAFVGTSIFNTGTATFTLNTGKTEVNFMFAIPATRTLTSVIDLDAANANLTSSYLLTTFNVDDANGVGVPYKIYSLTIAIPYSSNHRHQITLS